MKGLIVSDLLTYLLQNILITRHHFARWLRDLFSPTCLLICFRTILLHAIKTDRPAYLSASKQSIYKPSTRISYKTLYLHTLETVHDWTLFLKRNCNLDSVYHDFAKAFDTVSHVKLLTKLIGYGIRGHRLGWIRTFLSSHSPSVKLISFYHLHVLRVA